MATTFPVKPFPSPAPRNDKLIDPFVVRGNDNTLRDAVNQAYDVAFANIFMLMGA